MWFLGLIIGAIVGAIGGVGGAVVGAIVGLAVGLSLSKKQPVIEDTWKLNVEDALRQLHQRVETLERRAGATPAREESGPQPATAAVSGSFVEPAPASETVVEAPVTAIAGSEAPPAETYPAHEAGSQTTTAAPAKTPLDNPFSRWLFGGNTLVRVGVIVLFFGVAFLLKYAAERDLVPIELRLVGVALGGMALL
ncbi:MAG TPA: DUF2339 domain-containing protein, partial [Verrucomicrobiae bacterium]|nr:DUF2339 domain-containing protein [Verrucomicrobiae bacterium]